MSGLHFSAELAPNNSNEGAKRCRQLTAIKSETNREKKETLLAELHREVPDSGILNLESLAQIDFDAIDGGVFRVQSEYPNLRIDFFESLVELFNKLDIDTYTARLFDSSSSGLAVWQMPESDIEDIDIEGLRVCLLGVDEDEGIHESLEENGALVKTEFDTSAEVIIYSEETDLEALTSAAKPSAKFIEQDQFWDEFAYLLV